jgi:hypothetical protein
MDFATINPWPGSKAVPRSSRLYRDERAARTRRPFRFDFNRPSKAGRVGLMACASQFQYGFNCVLRVRCIEKRETVKATEGDEVESLRFLEPFQDRPAWIHHNPATI